jgi:hypothetical protein
MSDPKPNLKSKDRKARASVSSAKSRRRKERAAARSAPHQVRPRTAEDIANEQTAEQLALRIWAAMVGQKVLKDMSGLMDELLQSHLLDDDDEEADEGWLDDQHDREKKLLKRRSRTGWRNIRTSTRSIICRRISIPISPKLPSS